MTMFNRPGLIKQDQQMGPQELLFYKRVLFLYGPLLPFPGRLDPFSPTTLCDALWALDAISHEPIYLVIDSTGGFVTSGLNLIDMMHLIKSDVVTIGRNCYSMAAIVLASGTKGKRYVFPHASTMLHLPTVQTGEKVDPLQMQKESEEFTRVKNELVDILMECGAKGDEPKQVKRRRAILRDIDRVFYLSAEATVKYGIADAILKPGDMELGPFAAEMIPKAFDSRNV